MFDRKNFQFNDKYFEPEPEVPEKYVGEVNEEGERHGKGRFIEPGGDQYEGDWFHGE